TPVANAKHKDGKSRSKSSSVGNSAFNISSNDGTSCLGSRRRSPVALMALAKASNDSRCGARKLKRPEMLLIILVSIITAPILKTGLLAQGYEQPSAGFERSSCN